MFSQPGSPTRFAGISSSLARFFISALFATLIANCLFAQSASSPSNGHYRSTKVNSTSQEQFIPYWTAEPGWHTELMLRNNLESGTLLVTPVLRLADGKEITLSPVSIAPGTVGSVNLHDALMQTHPEVMALNDAYGSAVLRYTALADQNLYASAMIHDDGHPIIFHLDGLFNLASYDRGSREGIWWLPKATTKGHLVLTNLSGTKQQGVLLLYDKAGNFWKKPLTLSTKQTVRFSVPDLVSQAGLQGGYGGVSFQMQHGAGQIASALILYDEMAGFSATMKMFDWDPNTSLPSRDFVKTGKWTTRAPMLALENPDPALQLPAQVVLHPRIFLRNVTDGPVKVQLRFHWRKGSNDGRASLPEMVLAAHETRVVDVQKLQDDKTLPQDAYWAQVTLTTNTLPGEVMAVAESFDDTLRYGAQTPFSDQLAFHLEGAAWQVDANHDSIIAAGNGSNHPVPVRLTFFYAGGAKKYQIEQTIAPDDQMWVDVGKLIYDRIPDKDGNVFPLDTQTGAYQLLDLSPAPRGTLYEGKVVTDKTYGHATYGCMICCGYRAAMFNPDPASVGLFMDSPINTEGTSACGGYTVSLDGYATSWWSNDTSILTVQPRKIHGVSAGSTYANALLTNIMYGPVRDGQTCPTQNVPVQGTGNVVSITSISPSSIYIGSTNVQLTINGSGFGTTPTINLPSGVTATSQTATDTQITLKVNVAYSATIGNNNVSVTADGATSNNANLVIDGPAYMTVTYDSYGPYSQEYANIERTVGYQVYNFSGSTTNLANQRIGEAPSTSTMNCTPTGTPHFASCSAGNYMTSNAGTFPDQWTVGAGNFTPAGCGFTVNYDHWQMCFNGSPIPITFGTLSGYVHTNSININGYVVPPMSGEIPQGTRINP